MPSNLPGEQAPAVILVKAYDHVLWSVQKAEKFPRSFRFSVGERIVQGSLDLPMTLVDATYSRDKVMSSRRLTGPMNRNDTGGLWCVREGEPAKSRGPVLVRPRSRQAGLSRRRPARDV